VGKFIQTSDFYDKLLAITDDVKGFSTNIKNGKGIAGKLLSAESEELYTKVTSIIDDAKNFTAKFDKSDGIFQALVFDGELTAKFRNIFNGLEETVTNVRNGKGALGMILNDSEIAQKVGMIFDQILGSIEDAREAAPLSSLGSFLFGAI